MRKTVITLGLLAFCVFIGLIFPDVEVVISFKGSLLGTPVIYVLPGLFYLKLLHRRHYGVKALNGEEDLLRPLNADLVSSESSESDFLGWNFFRDVHWRDWLGAAVLIVFGLVTGIISFIMTVVKLI